MIGALQRSRSVRAGACLPSNCRLGTKIYTVSARTAATNRAECTHSPSWSAQNGRSGRILEQPPRCFNDVLFEYSTLLVFDKTILSSVCLLLDRSRPQQQPAVLTGRLAWALRRRPPLWSHLKDFFSHLIQKSLETHSYFSPTEILDYQLNKDLDSKAWKSVNFVDFFKKKIFLTNFSQFQIRIVKYRIELNNFEQFFIHF